VLQVLEHQHRDPASSAGLVARVTACRELVWACCVEAVAREPDADREVPAADDLAAAHRALSRVATAVAQAAQALVIAEADPAAADRAVATATAHAEDAAAALRL
jgi:ABC-type sugar transport system substrate-binding protein